MAAGVRDVDRRRMRPVAVVAHPPRRHRHARSRRLPTVAPVPRCVAGLGAHPGESWLDLRRYRCGGLDRLRGTRTAVLPGRPATARCPSPRPCARCLAPATSAVMATFAGPRDLIDAFARALNAKDADELGELFTDDAEFVNIMGMR